MLSRFHTIPERHGRTDGIPISISRVSMLTCDKNYTLLNRKMKQTHLRELLRSVTSYFTTPISVRHNCELVMLYIVYNIHSTPEYTIYTLFRMYLKTTNKSRTKIKAHNISI